MEIKICGIRRREDIEIVNKYKPDYIGFIFADTKRYIEPEHAGELAGLLNRDIKTVGVFVNSPIGFVKRTVETAHLDVVQLHGGEDEEYIKSLGGICEIWKAIRVRDGADIPDVYGADKILLDKYVPNEYGGTGERFDWSRMGTLKSGKPIILAGGLTKDNVCQGIEIFNPVCVDVSSAVETDGFKDENKIKEFIDTVRNVENEQNRRKI